MREQRYIISDASKMLKVESHVLRYWEEELGINIPRNEMGHRYYTDEHIKMLKNVRDLKEQGYGLRSIKMMINRPKDSGNCEIKKLPEVSTSIEKDERKMEQFQKIMGSIVTRALEESTENIITKAISKSTETMSKEVGDCVSEKVLKGVDYMMRVQDEKEEERYRKIDEVIRKKQNRRANEHKMLEKLEKEEKKREKKVKKANQRAERDRQKQEKSRQKSKKLAFSTFGK